MRGLLGLLLGIEFIWIIISVVMILLSKRPATDRFSWKNITKYSLLLFWLTIIGEIFSNDFDSGLHWSIFTFTVFVLSFFYRYLNKTNIWSKTTGKTLGGIMLLVWALITISTIKGGSGWGWLILNILIFLPFIIFWLIRNLSTKKAHQADVQKVSVEALMGILASQAEIDDEHGSTLKQQQSNSRIPFENQTVHAREYKDTSILPTPVSVDNPQKLISQIVDDESILLGDRSQKDRLDKLVGIGINAVPDVISAIQNVLLFGKSDMQFKNAGLLCETIGKIGGENCFEQLKEYVFTNSKIFEYHYVRDGAIRGLGHLRDQRAIPILLELSKLGLVITNTDIVKALINLGYVGAETKLIVDYPGWLDPRCINDPPKIAYEFSRNQLNEVEPDFRGFDKILERFEGYQKNHSWFIVGNEYKKKGLEWHSMQCYVKGLTYFSENRLATWDSIKLPDEIPNVDTLRKKLMDCYYDRSDPTSIGKIVFILQDIFGEPGVKEKPSVELSKFKFTLD